MENLSGASLGERGGKKVVLHYGAPLEEYQAARQATALFDLSFRDALVVTGEDRVSFVHGMCTQDIKGLEQWQSGYATLVTVKGAMVADARVLRREQDVVLDLEPGTFERVREFLDRHLISEEAELHDGQGEVGVLGLCDKAALQTLKSALGVEAAPRVMEGGKVVGFTPPVVEWEGTKVALLASLLSQDGVDLLLPKEKLGALWARLVEAGARPCGLEALEWVRVEDGLPRFGADLLETTIPMEAELTHAISYQKGCYVGQEVIARATFRGQMSKKLVGLLFGEQAPPQSAELRVAGKKVGFVTSVVRSPRLGQVVGLGYVHRAHLEPGTELSVGEGPAVARIARLPLAASETK